MRTEQYLEIYDFTIPFTDKMVNMYKASYTIIKKGEEIISGMVEDIRFCECGELRITNDLGKDNLAFEIKINGEYYGIFDSEIKTPPISNDFLKNKKEHFQRIINEAHSYD